MPMRFVGAYIAARDWIPAMPCSATKSLIYGMSRQPQKSHIPPEAGPSGMHGPYRLDFLHLAAAAYRTTFHSAEAARADRNESDRAVVSHIVSSHQWISRGAGPIGTQVVL
jgi:hypothetical protein